MRENEKSENNERRRKIEGMDEIGGDKENTSGEDKEMREICIYNREIEDISSIGSLEGVSLLHLHSNKLKSLKGLPTSLSLIELNLSSNLLGDDSDLESLSSLLNLKTLDISANYISSLQTFPSLYSVETFIIAFNRLESLDGLDCFRSLQRLDVRGNLLSSVFGFSVIGILSDLKEIKLSNNNSTSGNNNDSNNNANNNNNSNNHGYLNPISVFPGEIVKIFEFNYKGCIDGKNRLEWVNTLYPSRVNTNSNLQSNLHSNFNFNPHINSNKIQTIVSNTPKVDALLEKYRQNHFLINKNEDKSEDEYLLNQDKEDKGDKEDNNHNNPWNHTFGVKSSLLRRGNILKKQVNEEPLLFEKIVSEDTKKFNSDKLRERRENFLLNKDFDILETETLTNSSMISVDDNNNQNIIENINHNTNNDNQNHFSNQNILQLSICLLKVMYQVESVKQVRHYFDEWREKTRLESVCGLKNELLQENELLRATVQMISQKLEEEKVKVRRLTEEVESLKISKSRVESEYREKLIQQEKICVSQKKEYLKLKELYKEFENKKKEESEKNEMRLMNEMRELRLNFEIEKNELSLEIELKNREINEEKYRNEELREENRQMMLKYLDENKELNEKMLDRVSSYEKLLEINEKEKKVMENKLNEMINEERLKYDVLERILNELKNERNELKNELLKLSENDIKKKDKRIEELERLSESLESDVKRLVDRGRENDEKISELRKVLLKLKNRCEELMLVKNENEIKLKEKEKEIGLMKREMESSKIMVENRELKIELYKLNESYNELLEEKKNKEKDDSLTIQTQQHQLSSLNVIIQTLKEKNKSESMNSKEIISDLESEIQELQMKNEDMEIKLNTHMKESKLTYKSKLKEFEESSQREIDKYMKEISSLREEVKQREKDFELVQSELHHINEIVQKDHLMLLTKDEMCCKLSEELELTKSKLQTSQQMLENEKNGRMLLLEDVKTLRSGLITNQKEYDRKVKELKKEVNKKQIELEEKSFKLQKLEGLLMTFQQLADVTRRQDIIPQSITNQTQINLNDSPLSLNSRKQNHQKDDW